MTHHLLGSAEVAKILGVTRQRVAQLAVADGFPSPQAELTGGRIWSRHDIEAWAVAHPDRGPGRKTESEDDQGWALHRLTRLAGDEARALGHAHVGQEHFVAAMLHAECPGVARPVLESFGMTLESARQRAAEIGGPRRKDANTAAKFTPRVQVLLERAKLEAEQLSDAAASSHHFLLAMVHDSAPTVQLDPEWVRQRVVALSDAPRTGDEPDADYLRRKAKARRVREARGGHELASYLVRSDGTDPRDRRPWGSMGWMGEPWREPHMPVQYTIDSDGVPVLGPTGRLFCMKTDEEGYMVVGDDNMLIQEEFDLPEGASVEWPEGFEPPPGASPAICAARVKRRAGPPAT